MSGPRPGTRITIGILVVVALAALAATLHEVALRRHRDADREAWARSSVIDDRIDEALRHLDARRGDMARARARVCSHSAAAGDAARRVGAAEVAVRDAVRRLADRDPTPAFDRLRRLADRALRTRGADDARALEEGLAAASRAVSEAPVGEPARARALAALTMAGTAWAEIRETGAGSAEEGRAAGQLAGWLLRATDELGGTRFPAPDTALDSVPGRLRVRGLPAAATRETEEALRALAAARDAQAREEAATATAARELGESERELARSVDALRTAADRRDERRLEAADAAGARTAVVALVVALLTVAVGIGIALWIARTVVAPFRRAAARILASRATSSPGPAGNGNGHGSAFRPPSGSRPAAGRFAG